MITKIGYEVKRKGKGTFVPTRALLRFLDYDWLNATDFSNCYNRFSGVWLYNFILVFWIREKSCNTFSCCPLFIEGVKCSQNICFSLLVENQESKVSMKLSCRNRLVRKRGLRTQLWL